MMYIVYIHRLLNIFLLKSHFQLDHQTEMNLQCFLRFVQVEYVNQKSCDCYFKLWQKPLEKRSLSSQKSPFSLCQLEI